MEGLYRKVTRGYYSKINKIYSEDLSKLLKCLIKVNPKERLTCRKFVAYYRWDFSFAYYEEPHQKIENPRNIRIINFTENH